MSDEQVIVEAHERAEPGRRTAMRKILFGTLAVSLSTGSHRALAATSTHLYAILDIGSAGSIVHHVVRLDLGDPANITYVPLGTIAAFADKYFVSATFDPASSRVFFALSDSDSNTSVENVYLYSVTFPDLLTVAPFFPGTTVYVNLNPQVTYRPANGLFYYAINNDPLGYDYSVNTIDSSGNIVVTGINVADIQNSNNGLQIFGSHIYSNYRPGNSFVVYHAGIDDNSTGSTSSPIAPQPPGQIWPVFDPDGVLWGTTQLSASAPPGYALCRLQCTSAGVPAPNPFVSELVGDMPTTFEGSAIANMTLFFATVQVPDPVQVPVPTTSAWGLAGLVATMGAAAAFMLRRVRGR